MAEEVQNKIHEHETKPVGEEVESTDRGLFGFMGKKEEKPQDEVIAEKFDEQVGVSEPEPAAKVEEPCKVEEKKPSTTLLEIMHKDDDSHSSSSDEEAEEGKETKKKKKGLKEKIFGEKKEEETSAPVELTVEEPTEEKKGFLEKIKEKLPGHHDHKKTEEEASPAAAPAPEGLVRQRSWGQR